MIEIPLNIIQFIFNLLGSLLGVIIGFRIIEKRRY